MGTIADIVDAFADAPPEPRLQLMLHSLDAAQGISYPELGAHISAAVADFRRQGVSPGERVIFPFETGLKVVASFLALMRMGAVPLSVRPHHIGTSTTQYLEFVERIARGYAADRILAAPSVSRLTVPLPRLELPATTRLPAEGEAPDLPALGEGDIAFVQFSSGSTSFPKGVPIDNGRLYGHARRIAAFDRRRDDEVLASWLPLYHDMGLIGGLMSCLYSQSRLYLSAPVLFLTDPIAWLDLLSDKGVGIFPTPNFALDYTNKRLDESPNRIREEWDFSRLRHIYIGSEPINPSTLDRFHERLAPFGLSAGALTTCYGMAEAVLMVAANRNGAPATVTGSDGRRFVSVGTPLEGAEARVVVDGRPTDEDGRFGEIQLKGGDLVGGYFEDSRGFYNEEGFFATGDIGFQREGELYVAGRNNERINYMGQSYFSVDFERVLEDAGCAKPGRVIVTDVDGAIHAALEPARLRQLTGLQAQKAQVQSALTRAFGIKPRLSDIHYVRASEITKTSSGKLQRKRLADRIRSGSLRHAKVGSFLLDNVRKRLQRVLWLVLSRRALARQG